MISKLMRVVAVLVLQAVFSLCHAQSYPSRPITLVVPAPAGGTLDSIARALAHDMSSQMGQPFIVDNKPGGGGILAVQTVTRAAPDGYTLLLAHSGVLVSTPHLISKVPYDVRRDLAFISQVLVGPFVLAVNQSVPAKDMKSFLAWAAENKDKVSFGSYGVGSFAHIAGAYLNRSRGLSMVHVAYKGEGPMVQDLAAGQTTMAISTVTSMKPLIQSGKVRPLAVFGDHRARNLPTVPSTTEVGLTDPEFKSAAGWAGLLARTGTPPAILDRLEKEARTAARAEAMARLASTADWDPIGSTAAEFKKEFNEIEPTVKRLIEAAGAKSE